MPTVIAHHDVKDTQHWLSSPKREEFFGPLGVTNIRTFTDPQNPTRVAVLMDVADLDTTIAALQTAGASEAMDHDGVLADTMVLLVETGSRGPRVTGRQPVRSGYTPPVTLRRPSAMTSTPTRPGVIRRADVHHEPS